MTSDPRLSKLMPRLGGLYHDPARIDRDASSLLRSSVGAHLRPEISKFVENNGETSQMLCLQGTVAIHFQGMTYQQLVDIYFPSGYPVRPPNCFVRLTPNMYIKEGHQHVASDGRVYLPYLHEWRPNTHNMIELVVAMSSVFSADPPVFTRPKGGGASASSAAAAAAQQPPPPSYSSSFGAAMAAVRTGANKLSASGKNSRNNSSSSNQQAAEQALAREAAEANRIAELARKADQEEERKRLEQEAWAAKVFEETKDKVNRKLSSYLAEYSRSTKEAIQNDWQDQRRLQMSEDKLKEQMDLLTTLNQDLEESLVQVDKSTAEIKEWLADHERRQAMEQAGNNGKAKSQKKDDEMDVDAIVQPVSALHEQMMELSAENHALTDALYYLDKALHRGTLALPDHLKQVRKLSKRQFLVRAHLLKISKVVMK